MAKRIGVFMDVSNLYYCIGKKFPNRKLDYQKYWDFVIGLGNIQQAIAFGAQIGNEASNFIYCLKQIGYQTNYKTPKSYNNKDSVKKKADCDVDITVSMINMLDRFDMIILGTADGDLVPAVEYCQQRGVDVVVFACGISRDLKNLARQYIEIPESLLEDKEDGQVGNIQDTDESDTRSPGISGEPTEQDGNTKSETPI